MVAALGATESLVGVSHECDYPAVMGSRARVTSSAVDSRAAPGEIDAKVRELCEAGGGLYALDEPLIRSLRPAPTVVTISATTLAGVFDDISRVGAALDRADEAAELLAGFTARMRSVHETLKSARAPRRRVAFLEWTVPVFPGGHWVPEMIRRAGGIDVLAEPGQHAASMTLEQVVAAEPEVVIIAPCGYDLARASAEARDLFDAPEWAFLQRVPVWSLDANAFSSRPGPRLVDGIEILARIFNPDLFSPLDGSHARLVNR
jgi:iron complex transport system substrate-binding protein